MRKANGIFKSFNLNSVRVAEARLCEPNLDALFANPVFINHPRCCARPTG